MNYGLYIIPILAFLIIIHELGHFVSARMVGVTVEEFGLGIPPRAKGWTRNGVIWSLNWIPLGGFVRVKGEDANDMEPGSMNTKGPWQRAFFLAAGSFMNLVTALVLMIFLVGVWGIPTSHLYLDSVAAGSPAEAAGLQRGDRVVEAGGRSVEDPETLRGTTKDFTGEPMSLVVERGGEQVEVSLEPREDPPEGQGALGVGLAEANAATVHVERVAAGSAAAAAGLRAGDRVVAVAGQEVADNYGLYAALNRAQGTTVPLTVQADGEAPREVGLAVPVRGLRITELAAGSPAAQAGWQPDDRIVAVGGRPVTDATVLIDALRAGAGQPLAVTVERAGGPVETTFVVPARSEDEDDEDLLGRVGINVVVPNTYGLVGFDEDVDIVFEDVPAAQVLPRGFEEAFDSTRRMIESLIDLPQNLDQVAGPVGMGQILNESLVETVVPFWYQLLYFTLVISLNLAIINLIPLPALDGGRLFFVLIELLRGGRRIAPEKEGVVHFVGLVVLLGLMFVIAFRDVDRILDGRSFLP